MKEQSPTTLLSNESVKDAVTHLEFHFAIVLTLNHASI